MPMVILLPPSSIGMPAKVPNALSAILNRLPPRALIFNDSAHGGWLLWRHPILEPANDGHAEAFPMAHFETYIKTSRVRTECQRFLGTTNSQSLLEEHSPRATAPDERSNWRIGKNDGYVR
jgi:hypothetical protein